MKKFGSSETAKFSMDTQELYYPIAVLIEELRNEDVQLRLNSIRQLKTIAIALGPEKTRNQLIPFLSETLSDEDEVLYTLAEQLATLVPYLGSPDGAYCLLPPLENLATVEDVTVRDKAIESLRHVLTLPCAQEIDSCGCPLVARLSEGTWYTSRIAASALISILYPRVRVFRRKELHNILKKLSEDDAPAVRRAVASRLGEIALIMSTDHNSEFRASKRNSNFDSGFSGGDSTLQTTNVSPSTVTTFDMARAPTEPVADYGGDFIEDSSNGCGTLAGDRNASSNYRVVWNAASEHMNLRRIVFPIYCRLLEDDHESVRLMAIESMVDVIRCLGHSDTETVLERIIRPAHRDQAWRVRCVLAEKFVDVFTLMKPTVARQRLMPIFINLLNDDEAEVRAVVVSKVKSIVRCLLGLPPVDPNRPTSVTPQPLCNTATETSCSYSAIADISSSELTNVSTASDLHNPNKIHVDSDVNTDEISALAAADKTIVYTLLPALGSLASDTNSHVRSGLASAVVALAPLFGKVLTVEHLLPMLLICLEDDSPDVRFNLISNLEHMNSVIGLDQVISCLLPSIMELAEDPAWRVRLVLIDYMPSLAQQLGVEVFDSQLTGICLAWLTDEVYAIREAAVNNMVRLGSIFGSEWIKNTFLPKVLQLATDVNYLRRMICLESVVQICEQVDLAVYKQHLIPVVLSMHKDHVPNVRFKVAQALGKLGERVEQADMHEHILPCLLQLLNDFDQDVKFYAEEALDKLHVPFGKSSILAPSQFPVTKSEGAVAAVTTANRDRLCIVEGAGGRTS